MMRETVTFGRVREYMLGWLSYGVLVSLIIILLLSSGGTGAALPEARASDDDPPTWSVFPGPILNSATGYPIRQVEARDTDGDGFPELFALINPQDTSLNATILAVYGSDGEDCKGSGCAFDEITARTFEGLAFHNIAGPALRDMHGPYNEATESSFQDPTGIGSQISELAGVDDPQFVLTRSGQPRERYLHHMVFDQQSGTLSAAPVMDNASFPSNTLCKLAKPGKLGDRHGVYWLAYSDLSSAPCYFGPEEGRPLGGSRDLYWQEIDDEGMLVPGTKVRLLRRTTARALAIGDFFSDADAASDEPDTLLLDGDTGAAENGPEIFLLEGSAGDERITIYQMQPEGNNLTSVEVCTLGRLGSEHATHGLVDIALGWLNKDHRPDIVGIKTGTSSGSGHSGQLATWTMREDWIPDISQAECGGIFAFEEQAIPGTIDQNSRLALYNGQDENYAFVNVPIMSLSESQTHLFISPRPAYETLPWPTLELEPEVFVEDSDVRSAVRIQVGNLKPGSKVAINRSTQGAGYCRRPFINQYFGRYFQPLFVLDLGQAQCVGEGEDRVCSLELLDNDEELRPNEEYTYCARAEDDDPDTPPAWAPSPIEYAKVQTVDVERGCPVEIGPVIATTAVWTSQFNAIDQDVIFDPPYVQSGIELIEAPAGRWNFQSAVRFDLRDVRPPAAVITNGVVITDVILRLKSTGVGATQSWGAPFEIGVWGRFHENPDFATYNESALWEEPSATEILISPIVYDTWELQPYLGPTRTWFQENHHVAEGRVNRLHFRDRYEPNEARQERLRFVEYIINGDAGTKMLTIVFLRPNATNLRDSIRPGEHKWAKWGFEIGNPNVGDRFDRMPQLFFRYLTCDKPRGGG